MKIYRYIIFISGPFKRFRIVGFSFLKEFIAYYRKYSSFPSKINLESSLRYRLFIVYNYFKITYYIPSAPKVYVLDIVPRRVQHYLLPVINFNKDQMVNKILFYRKLDEHGIPFPEVYIYKKDRKNYPLKGKELDKGLYIEKAFAKQITGSAGKGSFIVENKSAAYLPDGYLFQKIENNHTAIYQLADNADNYVLNTIRIHSYKCENGCIEIQSAHLKLSTGDITDNIGTGGSGIGVAIDIETGFLMEEGFAVIGKKRAFRRHPKGKIDFKGFKVPFWEETIKLLYQLHDIFSEIRSVGWDIAITNNGPSVIEGNAGGDIFIPQIFIRPYYQTKMIQENIIKVHE